jgi:hypothetical protein
MKEFFGYTEPFRRFVQNETFSPQANEIPNTAASWLPGDDYYTNFHEGDPFIKVPEGYARLPGAGYEALHPELEGVNPEDYPDIHKMAILADVAPYSREYNQVSSSLRTPNPSRARNGRSPSCSRPPGFFRRSSAWKRSRGFFPSCRQSKTSRARQTEATP